MIVHNPNGTLPVDTIDFPAEHWPALKEYIAKTYGKSREQKIREAVEAYRKNKEIRWSLDLTDKERARRIVEFAVEQLNEGWKPDCRESKCYVYHGEDGWTYGYWTRTLIGGFVLRSKSDLPLLLSLCGEEMEVLRG